jgi:N-acetylmuramoyl-L-alanine amidase
MIVCAPLSLIQAKDFTVVIDAGHGGHDVGAIGQNSKEKDITLKAALAIGNLIESNCKDVTVIYTRKTDIFIPLHQRTEIANNAKADLFISIHANSVPKGATSPQGFEIYSMGLARSEANLEVAKRENSVVLYESDYKTRYQGFDPNSAESDIIFEVMQDKYMKESVHFASIVQSQFRNSQRRDRGVHQADFCVLRTSAMPSVLIELGFISSPDEENYMNTDDGMSVLSQGVYRAFTLYKREWDLRLKGTSSTIVPPPVKVAKIEEKTDSVTSDEKGDVETKATIATSDNDVKPISKPEKRTNTRTKATNNNMSSDKQSDNKKTDNKKEISKKAEDKSITESTSSDVIFKIQLMAARNKLAANDSRLKDIDDIECIQEDGYYKYLCAASPDYNAVYRKKKDLMNRFNGAFIVAYSNGTKIDVVQAIRQFKTNRKNIK